MLSCARCTLCKTKILPCSPFTSGKKQLWCCWYQHSLCLAGWAMACWSIKEWRSGNILCLSMLRWAGCQVSHSGKQGNLQGRSLPATQESAWTHDQYPACLQLAVWNKISAFSWVLSVQRVRKISWEGDINAPGQQKEDNYASFYFKTLSYKCEQEQNGKAVQNTGGGRQPKHLSEKAASLVILG